MDTIGVFEAKTKLSELLDRVATGEEVVITRHGVPVAKLIPANAPQQEEVAHVVAELRRIRKGVLLNPPGAERVTIRELIEDGRK